jgi:hypothetical protein
VMKLAQTCGSVRKSMNMGAEMWVGMAGGMRETRLELIA